MTERIQGKRKRRRLLAINTEVTCSLLSCIALYVSFKAYAWKIMIQDRVTMIEWDPSIIITTPFPTYHIACLSGVSSCLFLLHNILTLISLAYDRRQTFYNQFLSGTLSTLILDYTTLCIILWISFFLLGMHPTYLFSQSIFSCMFVSSLLLCPTFRTLPTSDWGGISEYYTTSHFTTSVCSYWDRLSNYLRFICSHIFPPSSSITTSGHYEVDLDKKDDESDEFVLKSYDRTMNILYIGYKTRRLCIVIMMILCMILRVLDHGLQIQRWPIPIIIGSGIGFILGSIWNMINLLIYT